jgi:threonine dehydrogenase-like Zn-dependent dehydrogenase
MVRERLALAKISFGVETLDRSDLSSDDVVARLREMVPGGADVVIEAVGFRFASSIKHKLQRAVGLETDTADILTEAISVVRKYGRVSIIGDYIGLTNQFPIGFLMMKHLTVRSGQTPCQKYFEEVMAAVQSGEVDPTLMITHRITLEQAPEAYAKLFKQADGWIKVFMTPQIAL